MISTFTVVLDANVLYGARLRSLLMELSVSGLFRAKWTDDIHLEWMTAVSRDRGIDIAKLTTTRKLMDQAVPDALVTGYKDLIDALTLPDPKDRHVLAAAIVCNASAIVTFNQKDFPENAIARYGLHTKHPDAFIMDVEGLEPGILVQTARQDWGHYQNPPLSLDQYIGDLRAAGCPLTATHLEGVRVLLES